MLIGISLDIKDLDLAIPSSCCDYVSTLRSTCLDFHDSHIRNRIGKLMLALNFLFVVLVNFLSGVHSKS